MRAIPRAAAVHLIVLLCALLSGPVASAEPLYVFASHWLDVESGELRDDVLIEIHGEVIHAITVGAIRPEEEKSELIDLTGLTVLPGLIDTHTHLCDNSHMDEGFDHWAYPAATFGIAGTVNARLTLEAGFTTVRDVSGPFYCDVALRDAIKRGWIEGPRMLVTGQMVTMTGGHGQWGNWIAPQHQVRTQAHAIADGVDEVRKAVRTHIRSGVDWIKVAATGGFGTSGSIPGAASYTGEELAAAVEEGRKQGIKVAAHAHGTEGIKNAITAGVASIEHGTMLDAEALEMMKEKGVFLVMDLKAAHFDLMERNRDYSDKQLDAGNEEEWKRYLAQFTKAHASGVQLAFGTDAGIYPHGQNAEQFELMVEAGLTPLEAIRSATVVAAKLLDLEERVGQLKPGAWADLIAVEGDPLQGVSVLQKVDFVMKEGRVVKGLSREGGR